MSLLAVATGLIAGTGAWAFRRMIGWVHNVLFLGDLSFYYDANVHTPASPWGWGVVLVPVAGSLVVAWLVKNFAPEAKGHGVPEVMDAIYYNDGRIRPRVALQDPLLKALRTMAEADAAVMLVSTQTESRKVENIVGVVTLARVAPFLKQVEGIG